MSAQNASAYTFSTSTGASLADMTGSSTLVASGVDDTPGASVAIGFNFVYCGTTYTEVSASPDGFVVLGTSAFTALDQFSNSITSTTNQPKIFPWWDDMATGSVAGGGKVHTILSGSSGSYIRIIEWFVTQPRNTSGAANSRFQLWLYEGSNLIEFRYGTATGTSPSASIGISNNPGTVSFSSVTASSHTSSNTTANNSNTGFNTNLTGGRMYAFAPPAPCSATPAPGNTISSAAEVCAGGTVSLSLQNTTLGTDVTYQWYQDGNQISGATNLTYTSAPITASTSFYCEVTCGLGTTASNFVSIGISATPVGGTANGPSTAYTSPASTYTVTGSVGSLQWQSATNIAGPYTNVSGATNATLNTTFGAPGTYYIRCRAFNPGCTEDFSTIVTTVVSLLANNVCDAVAVPVGVINGPYTNVGATGEAGEPVPPGTGCNTQTGWCNSTGAINSLWFTFVAPPSGKVSIEMSPANWDSQLAIYSAASCTDLLSGGATLIAANDDAGGSPFHSFIQPVCVVPGQTYYVLIDGYNSNTNANIGFRINEIAIDNSFTGLAATYTDCDADADLTPAVPGGIFFGTGVSGSSFSPSAAGVGSYTISYQAPGACSAGGNTSVEVSNGTQIYYADTDNDTYGDPSELVSGCSQPVGYVSNNSDCDDTDSFINPGATEICANGIDEDCSGVADDGTPTEVMYADTDGDGYGDDTNFIEVCDINQLGYTLNSGDCDDTNGAINPGATEICDNGADDDCDGTQFTLGLSGPLTISNSGNNTICDTETIALCSSQEGDSPAYVYAIPAFDGQAIKRYTADVLIHTLTLDGGYTGPLMPGSYTYGIDKNPVSGIVYAGSGAGFSSTRTLYSIDLGSNTVNPVGPLVSTGGSNLFQDFTFDSNGQMYAAFGGGIIQKIAPDLTPTAFVSGLPSGSVGLTYDGENNRLLYASGSSVYAIALPSGTVTFLYNFSLIGGSIQGIEYIGGGIAYASSTFSADIMHKLDLNTGTASVLLSPTGYSSNIKDLLYVAPVQGSYQVEWTADGVSLGGTTCISVSPDANVTYTLTVSNTDGCSASTSIEIEVTPSTVYYYDYDGDGFGSDWWTPVTTCDGAPSGYVDNNTDCDPYNGNINPGATEICDGVDNNCDGTTDEGFNPVTYYYDEDGDGYGANEWWYYYYGWQPIVSCDGAPNGYVDNDADCNNFDSSINPDATEVCDGQDNDCDGEIDEGITPPGDPSVFGINQWIVYAWNAGDAEDTGNSWNTNYSGFYTTSVLNFNSENDWCSGCSPSNAPNYQGCPVNADNHSWSAKRKGIPCGNYTINVNGHDDEAELWINGVMVWEHVGCCDSHADVWTGDLNPTDEIEFRVTEGGGGSNGNISFVLNSTPGSYWYADLDEDGYYGGDAVLSCEDLSLSGYSLDNEDCNDNDASINPGATEVCNGIDDNCDGTIDEGFDQITYYYDYDGDGYGSDWWTPVTTCDGAPSGYVDNNTDCDPYYGNINPGATEICDGLDNNCDGTTDEGFDLVDLYYDNDSDGFGYYYYGMGCDDWSGFSQVDGDCDDYNAFINPSASEVCNNADDDCNGLVDDGLTFTEYFTDADGDGYGATSIGSYCQAPTNCMGSYELHFYPSGNYVDESGWNIYDVNNNLVASGYSYYGYNVIPLNLSNGPFTVEVYTGCYYADNTPNLDLYFNGNVVASASTSGCYGYSSVSNVCNGVTGPFVTQGGDCNDANSSINPGMTEVCGNGIDDDCDGLVDEGCTRVQNSQCGLTLPEQSTAVLAISVPGVTVYRFKIQWNGNTVIVDRPVRWFRFTDHVPGFTPATTYQVSVSTSFGGGIFGGYGQVCNVTLPHPLTKVQASQCGATLSNISGNVIADLVTNATGYRFKVSNGGVDQILTKTVRFFKFTELGSWSYGNTYQISVAVEVNGTFGPYGAICDITTPAPGTATTTLDATACGIVLSALSTNLNAISVPQASEYEFLVENTVQSYSQSIVRTVRWFRMNMMPPSLLPGTTYTVKVRAKTAGVWGPYGAACNVTTPGTPLPSANPNGNNNNSTEEEMETEAISGFDAVAFPNPFADAFTLNVRSESNDAVIVRVYDMNGKLLENRNLQASEAATVVIGGNLAAGMYHVTVMQGDNVKTMKMIKTIR